MGETHRAIARHRPGREPLAGALVAAVTTVAVPVAVAAVPNLSGLVVPGLLHELDAGPEAASGLVRAYGLGLPALLAAVPVGARLCAGGRPAALLVGGLALVAVAELAGLLPVSAPLIGVVRTLYGVGGGLILPASLALALRYGGRARAWLTGWWIVVLLVGLFAAAPMVQLALASAGWRAPLRPFPWLVALGLLFGTPLLPADGGGRMRATDRTLVLMPSGLAWGTAVLVFGTTRGWSGTAQLVASGVLLAEYLALAVAGGTRPGPGGRTGLPLVAVATGSTVPPMASGVLGMRTFAAGPDAGLASAPGALAVPLSAAVLMAGLGVVAGVAAHRRGWPGCPAGLVTQVVGLLITMAGGTVPVTVSWMLVAGGLGVAWGTALTGLPRAGALFSVQLVFPVAAAGHLLCGAVQLRDIRGMGQSVPVDAAGLSTLLATGGRTWPLIAASFVAVCAVGVVLARCGAPARAVAEHAPAGPVETEGGPTPVHR